MMLGTLNIGVNKQDLCNLKLLRYNIYKYNIAIKLEEMGDWNPCKN